MSPKLNELREALCREVDDALKNGEADAAERERIYERLQELMTEVWADKMMTDEEREIVWDIYETCLVKLRKTPK